MRSPALAAAATACVVTLAALWSARPAAPRPADVPATEFSEARARPVVERLARTKRVAGSPQADDALRFLEAEMRAIPGLEVEVQAITAFAHGPYSGPSIYTVRNLVARLSGTDLADEAVLVAAHYDSAVMSHGAADDGLACAAVVEAARCLAAGPRPRRSVVFLLDEGEELGLFGAQGFLHHAWAQDVVTFVNLEAAGCRGRPLLFQTGPGDPWLAAAYARAAPHPHGTVLGQDVFQSGVIPSDTDFRVYRDQAGLRGLDVALYRDGWGYHTTRDRIERLEPGSLQEMGDNTVAVLRELSSTELPAEHVDAPAVYYDILGAWMAAYTAPAAWLLALVALATLVHALRTAGRERGIGVLGFAGGAVWVAGALVAVVVVTLAVATLPALRWSGVGGWYARPWLAVAAYGAPAVVVVLSTLRLAVLRGTSSPVTAATRLVGGVALVFATLLAVLTWAGVGSGYLALWWVVGSVAGLRLAARGRLATAVVVGGAFPGLLTAQAADALIATFVPLSGRMSGPTEHVVAVLVALPLALALLLPAALVVSAPPRRGRGVLGAAAAVGAAAWVAVLAWSPYTAARPQRVDHVIVQEVDAASGVTRTDRNPFRGDPALPAFPAAGWSAPRGEPAPEGIARRVRVRLDPHGATGVYLSFDRAHVERVAAGEGDGAAWQPWGPPVFPSGARALALVAPPRGGLDVTFDLLTAEPVEVGVTAWHTEMPPEVVRLVDDGDPDWVSPETAAWVRSVLRL